MKEKEAVTTDSAPAAIGPYSQAITFGEFIFTSGQLPLVPETMAFPEGGIREQTKQSLENVKAILEKSGATLGTVIKTTCFLTDMADFSEFNDVYSTYFTDGAAPARSCVEASNLPKGAKVEIEVVAYRRANV